MTYQWYYILTFMWYVSWRWPILKISINLWAWMVRSHTNSYIHTPVVKNVIKNAVSWTTESSFAKMLVNVLFLAISTGIRWRCVLSESCSGCFISEGGKRPWYPFARRLGGSQSWYGCGGEGIEPCCQCICQLNYCSSNSWQKHLLWLTLVHWFCIKFDWLHFQSWTVFQTSFTVTQLPQC